MRIDKFISESGIASRKEASAAAKRGGVIVNGRVVKDLSEHIDPEKAEVSYLGEIIEYQKYVYILLNKPEGYVSATEDTALPVVTELLPERLRKRELFPVGRLDRDTVGVMLLTNNGPLAHRLLAPKRHVEKRYYFKCAEPLAPFAEDAFKNGVTLADGYECKSAEIIPDPDRLGGVIVLTEGKYHQIKRMIAALDNRVTYLERITFACLPIAPLPKRGEWRYLTEEEAAYIEALG